MIDCHLHLQDRRFPGDLDGIMVTARGARVSHMVVNGTHPDDWQRVEDLSLRYPGVIPSFGLHPWRVNEAPGDWNETLEAILCKYPLAGVGEIGLDKWIKGYNLDWQRGALLVQLEIAQRLRRPVSLHCLQAWGSLLECLDQSSLSTGWLLHSYAGPLEMVGDFIARGAFFSLSGYFFRPGKEEKLSLFEEIPKDRILLETDAPDMMPPVEWIRYPLVSPDTGEELNHPANLISVYEAYAAWRGCRVEEVIDQVRMNFEAWFFEGRKEKREDFSRLYGTME